MFPIEVLHAALRHWVQVIDWRTSLLWRLEWSGGFTNHRMKRIRSEWAAMVAGLDLHARKLAIDTFQVIHPRTLTSAITAAVAVSYASRHNSWIVDSFPRTVLSLGQIVLLRNTCELQMIESRMDGTSDGIHHYSTEHSLLGGAISKFPMQLMSNFLCYDEIAEEIAAVHDSEAPHTEQSDEDEDSPGP
jgi:hypothetical protein